MRAPGTTQVVTSYGFLAKADDSPSQKLGKQAFDLFIPEELARPLQLRPGATFLIQGLEEIALAFQEAQELPPCYVRSRTGLELEDESRVQFIVTVRFPNTAGKLRRFLELSARKEIQFRSLRTFGYRGSQESDLVFEGSIPADKHDFEDFVYRGDIKNILEKIARSCGAEVIRVERLKIDPTFLTGQIGTTLYHLDIPILGGRFFRLRFENQHLLLSKILLIRLVADYGTGTMMVDISFGQLEHHLLSVTYFAEVDAPPVTEQILSSISKGMNVEAISGAEFLSFDPEAEEQAPGVRGMRADYLSLQSVRARPRARIEILCTLEGEVKAVDEKISIENGLLTVKGVASPTVEFLPVNKALEKLRLAANDEIHRTSFFRRLLNEGRYVYVGTLGKGSFGTVHKYLDLVTCQMVAGKHFHRGTVRMEEIHALELAMKQTQAEGRENLVALHGRFYDGKEPVLITECLDFSLDIFEEKDGGSLQMQFPKDLSGFFDMAIQLLLGLKCLHQGTDDRFFIHRDIKPSNIGCKVTGARVMWKLIDFGLAKLLEENSQRTKELRARAAGSLPYMSPQAVEESLSRNNDIYSLGVVFFQVLCNWQHPSRAMTGGSWKGNVLPIEVVQQLRIEQGKSRVDDARFDEQRWSPGERFSGGEDSILLELKTLIFRMIALRSTSRYQTAATTLEAFQDLNRRLIRQ